MFLKRLKEASDAATLAANRITGGDSFAYIDFPPGLVGNAQIVKIGDAPLYELRMNLSIQSGKGSVGFPTKELGNLPAGSNWPDYRQYVVPLDGMIPSNLSVLQDERISLSIELAARNGNWREFYWLYRHGNYSSSGYRIYRIQYDREAF